MTIAAMRPQLPSIIEPEADESIVEWLTDHGALQPFLLRSGAVLFRGFRVADLGRFEEVAATLVERPGEFLEESSPRSRLGDFAFTSTDYPSRFPIQFHSEYSYSNVWPGRLVFGCLAAAESGGATLIADARRVLNRLDPDLIDEFRRRRVQYVRNYVPALGVPWQTAFGTDDPAEVERSCRERGIGWTWADDALRTCQVADAIVDHPVSHESVWFNHVLIFNVNGMESADVREALAADPDSAPTNSYFGDGAPIPVHTIDAIRTAYQAESVAVDWEPGDVLVIDNMLTAHARASYRGTRRIVVSMGCAVLRSSLTRADSTTTVYGLPW